MRFDRLRLNGFKSFVDPTDLLIRDGLTGVVGPNGCGKSNLLEALRWVMGENRPTAMRGDGMEDVIFAGTTRRSAKSHAEVTLTIDNRAHLAPASFNAESGFDITRRITRDAGSAYKISGKDVRARDVQMLFADASTGAHSPALVRQGQISELINARPKSRRRILEEAAGISGLYQRRHEAELKLNGAEQNLTRVDDTIEQLSAQAASLARQARAAARYREIGAAIRLAEGLLLYRRWFDAEAARVVANESLSAATKSVAAATAESQKAAQKREAADEALPPLREEEQIAAAVLSRLMVDKAALDESESRSQDNIRALTARLAQLDKDIEREAALNRDAVEVVERLQWEKTELEKAGQGSGARHEAASKAAEEASDALRMLEARLADLTDESARLAARHQSAERLAADLGEMLSRAETAAQKAEQAATQAGEAGARAEQSLREAQAAQDVMAARAEAAEDALFEAETARTEAEATESAARMARAEIEGEAGALNAELTTLRRMVERGRSEGDALLNHVQVADGYEIAFGAALGDDLSTGLSTDGEGGWRDLPFWDDPQPLPSEARPLAQHIRGPNALNRRLSQTGLIEDTDTGARLQAALLPGQRLVTRTGDVFRWDGLIASADQASSAAALHLQQVNQLSNLTAAADEVQSKAEAAARTHEDAKARLAECTSREKSARDARRDCERLASESARAMTRAESELALASSRAESARGELTRHLEDAANIRTRLTDAQKTLADLPDHRDAAQAVENARTGVEAARMATMARRAALDELRRDENERHKRLQEIAQEDSGWRLRLQQAGTRTAELTSRRDAVADDLTRAEAEPAAIAERRSAIEAREEDARDRLDRVKAQLIGAETNARSAALAEREAERIASELRETRASIAARSEAAQHSEVQARTQIREQTGGTPEALEQSLSDGDKDTPAAALDDQLARLRAQRDGLGSVNLRADEDKREIEAERDQLVAEKDDLVEAIRKLRAGIGSLNREGRERLLAAFETVNANFSTLFTSLFGGGEARLVMVESDDPLDAGLEIMCQPPGKKLSTLSLLSGGEQTLTALALIFAVFLANPAPICVLDEVDAPLDDANVSRFCDLLDEMTRRTDTRFLIITHHGVTMARMDRLFGVTMVEQGVSQLVSVDLKRAESLVA